MKTPQKKNSSRQRIITYVIAIIAIIAGYATYAYTTHSWPFDHTSTTQNDTTQSDSVDSTDPLTPTDEANTSTPLEDKEEFLDTKDQEPTTPESPDNTAPLPAIDLTAKTSGNNLVITTNLATISSGTCTLTLKSNQTTITKNAEVIYTPEYSTCAGFSIKTSDLDSGTWNITLLVKTNDASVTKNITYTL